MSRLGRYRLGRKQRRMARVFMAGNRGFDDGIEASLAQAHGTGPEVCRIETREGFVGLVFTVPLDKCPYKKRKYRRAWLDEFIEGAGK